MPEEKTDGVRIAVLYSLIAAAFVFILIKNFNDPWPVVTLSGLFLLSVTFRNALFHPDKGFARLTFLLDILLVCLIGRLDGGSGVLIYYLAIVGDASLSCSLRFSSLITVLSFSAFATSQKGFASFNSPADFLYGLAFYLLAFISVQAVLYLVRYEIQHKEILRNTMYELRVKTKLLEDAYKKLQKTSQALKDLTVLKERNEMARELHDTVGHTLTTVLFELEAGEKLQKHNPDLAAEKISLAKEQVRKGLVDIRQSVTALQSGRKLYEFIPSIQSLIEETTQSGNVFIHYEIDRLPSLDPRQEKAVFRALQEGLTNGIKHGCGTAFVFKLKYLDHKVHFLLQDNGSGTEIITYGFGLTTMGERVQEAGGLLQVSSSPGEGFTISFHFEPERKKISPGLSLSSPVTCRENLSREKVGRENPMQSCKEVVHE